ncbi:MAG: DUF4157 domain-containing protein [Candidatus Omnitrophica bacterium]|nr:DUF4157 domain-containing protein [Candidatus Omnitrophota bacterium]
MGERIKITAKKPLSTKENSASNKQKIGFRSQSSHVDRILFLQRTIGNQAVLRLIKSGALQANLRIGQTGDVYEQEADRVADEVMRMPEPGVQRQVEPEEEEEEILQTKLLVNQITPLVQRQVEEEEEEEMLQAKNREDATSEVTHDLESQINAFKGGGRPLVESERDYFEPRFGHDFSQVRVHTDAQAAESARAVNARAFTLGRDVVFGAGQYAPESSEERRLMAHELTHTLQQQEVSNPRLLQRIPASGVDPKVYVIGSPSPGEIAANHSYQFVDAARFQGVDEDTVWIVERTGYEAGNVDLGRIEQYVDGGQIIWLTPENNLVDIINNLPQNSISRFSVFSHGVPSHVTLRYGWEHTGRTNYGLSISEVRQINRDRFIEGARVTFDSCNTGTADWLSPRGNLAQQFADQTGQNVEAWTGRTSYRDVNATDVAPSETINIRVRGPDFAELASTYIIGREPRRRIFRPVRGRRVHGFQSTFEISARLPSSRTFRVPADGSVVVTCPNPGLDVPEGMGRMFTRGSELTTFGTAMETEESYQGRISRLAGRFWVALYRERLGPDESIGMHTFPVQSNDERAVWTGLTEGTYYLEIYRLSGNPSFLIISDIIVDVYVE